MKLRLLLKILGKLFPMSPNRTILAKCPACEKGRVASVNHEIGMWYCFACHKSGAAADLR